MIELRELYYCEICGNVVEVVNAGKPALVCCGEPMKKLEAQTKDSSVEKHVPYVESHGDSVTVKIGQNESHPMIEKHYIKFIEVLTKDKVFRAELNPGDEPKATFPVKKEEITEAREWCNIHGLWKS